ncbi:MAG TPA: cache domain-containing protein [Polyangiaceae bacterium]|nr:cache domain-containing protein [Polyangiaceae bacterium]
MSLKVKLIALSTLALFVAIAMVSLQVLHQAALLSDQQSQLIERSLMAQKQAELVHAVSLVKNEIQASLTSDDALNRDHAKEIVAAAHSGEDGYFFLYDQSGTCLVHPRQPELVGRNLQTLVDARGRRVIPALIATAQRGSGFQRYTWHKPSTGTPTEKLSYVSLLQPWGWMIGTGVYLDDVEAATAAARESSKASAQQTIWRVGIVGLAAVLAVFLGALLLTVSEQRLADRKLRAMAERILHLQEEERARIARELHDGIVQLLAAARFQLEASRQRLATDPAGAEQCLDKGLARLDDSIVDVRRISHALRPATVDQLGLVAALNELARDLEERSRTKVSLLDRIGPLRIGERQSVALFRIAQEALTNIERHAAASEISIELGREDHDRLVHLRVVDNGRGFNPRVAGDGMGLTNMRRRTEDLGGKFWIDSRPGRTEINALLGLRTIE